MGVQRPAHFLSMNPKAWLDGSLPEWKNSVREVLASCSQEQLDSMSWMQRHACLAARASIMQERRWEIAAGISAENSHFTLIVPVHNEEHSLPSFFSTLMLCDIPASVHIQVIFVTNACSDASSAMIDDFLATIGTVFTVELDHQFKDASINRQCVMAREQYITFMHVNTPTRGKANALGIGNEIARASSHLVAMCVDANSFMEPDAIRRLFAAACTAFKDTLQPGDTVLLCGDGQKVGKASAYNTVMDTIKTSKQHFIEDSGVVTGCLMAWNTTWMQSIGGPPEVALEDYALGVLARVGHYQFEQVEARIWSYHASSLTGLLRTRARYVRGLIQILDYGRGDPAIKKIIEQKAYYMQKLPARLNYLLRKAKENPEQVPRYIATFLLWEYALQRGKRDYRRNPQNQSWEKIEATY